MPGIAQCVIVHGDDHFLEGTDRVSRNVGNQMRINATQQNRRSHYQGCRSLGLSFKLLPRNIQRWCIPATMILGYVDY